MKDDAWVAEHWLEVLRARELLAAVLKARRALERFPSGHRLRHAALAELARCSRRVLAFGPLTVRIADAQLWLDDAHLLDDVDGLCSRLAEAGVSELTLTPAAVPGGMLGLADACSGGLSARARRMRLAGGVLPGIRACLVA